MKRIKIDREWSALLIIALLAVAYSIYLAVTHAKQPPLDEHSFRQTQTALTSYWFIHDGFRLAYETPVAGAPWAIPFEFPIYQVIVAYTSKLFDFDLNSSGRLISYFFLLLTIVPAIGITKRLKLPNATYLYFVAVLFSMPIYVYWGRTFMIETAALFFGIAAIKCFLDYMLSERSFRTSLFFTFFSTLCILQKATTALPIMAVLSIVFFIHEVKKADSLRSIALIKNLALTAVIFIIPVIIGFVWVIFTDQVKLANPLGAQVTSAALDKWNWGTLSQRFSSEIWTKVVWSRILSPNVGALLGVVLLMSPFLVRTESRIKLIALGVLSLGIVPLFVFTNLHLVHDYYQTANAIFFAYGVAIALAVIVAPILGKRLALFILAMLVLSNHMALKDGYLYQIENEFTKSNQHFSIGKIINREVPIGMQFVAYGNDWSSTFAYISERKSFTVPRWFKEYDQVIANPERFLEQGRLGAIISCTTEKPTATQIFDWVERNGLWKVGETNGCLVVTPEKQILNSVVAPSQCRGVIDRAEVEVREGKKFVILSGWSAPEDGNHEMAGEVFLKVSSKDTAPIYLQALRVPRLDVNEHLKISNDIDIGFSRIIFEKFRPGIYEVELIQSDGRNFRSCGVQKSINLQ